MSSGGLRAALEREGRRLSAAESRAVLLAGGGAWWVRAGVVDVFAVRVRGGAAAGRRNHVFRAKAGSLLLSVRPDAGVDGPGLLVVAAADAELVRLDEDGLRTAAAGAAAEFGPLLDAWVEGLARGLAGDLPPKACRELGPGAFEAAEESAWIRPRRRGVLWVTHRKGRSLLFGHEDLVANGTGAVPVSDGLWLEVESGSVLELEETGAMMPGRAAWTGLALLHALVLRRCGDVLEARTARERRRVERLRTLRRTTLGSACAHLVAPLTGRRLPTGTPHSWADGRPADRVAAVRTALQLVAEHVGVEVAPPPARVRAETDEEMLEASVAASRVRVRQVLLRDGWWRRDGGAFLGRMESDGRAVALLPDGGGGYVLHDPVRGRSAAVDEPLADRVDPRAHTLYRPFENRRLGLRDLLRFGLKGSGRDLFEVVAVSVVVGLLGLAVPIFTGMIFNDVIPTAARSQLLQLTFLLLVVAGVTALFEVSRAVALVRIEGRTGESIQSAVWDRLLGLPLSFHRPYTAGDLAARAMGIDTIRQILSAATVLAFLGVVVAFFQLALMFRYSGTLGLKALMLVAVAVAATAVAGRLQIGHEREVTRLQTRISGQVLQFLSSITKLRAAGAEDRAFGRWAEDFGAQRALQYRARSVSNALASFNGAYPVIATLVLYALAVPLLSEQTLRVGDFLAFMAAFTTGLNGMLTASRAALGTLKVVPLYEHAEPILASAPEVDETKADPGELTGRIEVQQVGFRYDVDGPIVLEDVTLHAEPGEYVAIVGPSGSGKSTLLRLLLAFETPASGAVYLDGQDLETLDPRAVRRQMGVVLQDGRLMSGDIFTNIVGATGATHEEAWEAARLAGFAEDVRAMPMGMHTVISEGGGTLSGGQRQRLMIARAVVHRPRIFLLDEATSALDNRTQEVVRASLDRLQATRLVVAHRLSTVEGADRIYVMDRGAVVETGTYRELMGRDGLFARLARRQMV